MDRHKPRPRILCLHKEPRVLTALRSVLRDDGWSVSVQTDPDRAGRTVLRAPSRRYAALLVDQDLGADVLESLGGAVKRFSPETRVVVLASAGADAVRLAWDRPWVDALVKSPPRAALIRASLAGSATNRP